VLFPLAEAIKTTILKEVNNIKQYDCVVCGSMPPKMPSLKDNLQGENHHYEY